MKNSDWCQRDEPAGAADMAAVQEGAGQAYSIPRLVDALYRGFRRQFLSV